MASLWLIMYVLVLGLIALDLGVLRPMRRRVSQASSIGYAAFYLLLGMAFNVAIYFIYEHHLFGAGYERGYAMAVEGRPVGAGVIDGPEATLQFLASFVLEIVLGLDSVFVIAAVFLHLGVRDRQQHRLLMWGLCLAVLVRAGMVMGFGELIHRFEWFRFILSLLLLLASVRMVLVRRENMDPEKNFAYRILKRIVPMSRTRENALLTNIGGRPALTPLIMPLLLIETADAFLAFDSIPASYAFTREPFLIFSAGCFALLVVRSMAPALMTLLARLRYFKIGLAMILVYTAIIIARRTSTVQDVLASADVHPVDLHILIKLAFVGAAIIVGLLAAALLGGSALGSRVSEVSPLGEDADKIARQALSKARKIGVAIIGITGLGLGTFMAVGPGPGIPVLLGSLLLLATEFAIAKRLVDKYRPHAEEATKRAAAQTRKRLSPWAMVGIIALTIGGGILIHLQGHTVINIVAKYLLGHAIMHKPIPVGLVISGLVPMVAGQVLLAYLAWVHKHDGEGAQQGAKP